MLLWDEESEGWEEALSTVSSLCRKWIALAGVTAAVNSFRPSFEAMFHDRTVAYVRQVLQRCGAQLEQSTGEAIGTEAFFEELHSLVDQDSALGLTSLVMAISTYVDCLEGEFTAGCTLDVLSASYEAVLNSERIGRVTPAAERQNENCLQLIQLQRELVFGSRSATGENATR